MEQSPAKIKQKITFIFNILNKIVFNKKSKIIYKNFIFWDMYASKIICFIIPIYTYVCIMYVCPYDVDHWYESNCQETSSSMVRNLHCKTSHGRGEISSLIFKLTESRYDIKKWLKFILFFFTHIYADNDDFFKQ